MRKSGITVIWTAAAIIFVGIAHAQTLSRSQNFLVSQTEVNAKASVLFQEIRSRAISKGTLVERGERYERIQQIAARIIDAAREFRRESASWAWEVIYVSESVRNAHCLPGGKITLYSGLVDSLNLSDDELAAVIGHEVAHALREHGREKRSNAEVAHVAVGLLSIAAGIAGYKHRIDPANAMNATRLIGGATASVFFLLPNSREMELEADAIGVELAARAGYDPAAAQDLWRKMNSNSGVEFLGSHPSSTTRISELIPIVAAAQENFSDRRLVDSVRRAYAPPLANEVGLRQPAAVAMDTQCELPGGTTETLALLACQRLGGTLRGERWK